MPIKTSIMNKSGIITINKTSMEYSTLGIIIIPKQGELFYLDLGLDNEEFATLDAPSSMSAFENVTTIRELLSLLDGCFYVDLTDEDDFDEDKWTLKDLVEFFDYDNVYPKFEKKVNALKTMDQIAAVIVFTNKDWLSHRKYEWEKYDFEENRATSGMEETGENATHVTDFISAHPELFPAANVPSRHGNPKTVFEPEAQPSRAAIKEHIEGTEAYQQGVHQTGASAKRIMIFENVISIEIPEGMRFSKDAEELGVNVQGNPMTLCVHKDIAGDDLRETYETGYGLWIAFVDQAASPDGTAGLLAGEVLRKSPIQRYPEQLVDEKNLQIHYGEGVTSSELYPFIIQTPALLLRGNVNVGDFSTKAERVAEVERWLSTVKVVTDAERMTITSSSKLQEEHRLEYSGKNFLYLDGGVEMEIPKGFGAYEDAGNEKVHYIVPGEHEDNRRILEKLTTYPVSAVIQSVQINGLVAPFSNEIKRFMIQKLLGELDFLDISPTTVIHYGGEDGYVISQLFIDGNANREFMRIAVISPENLHLITIRINPTASILETPGLIHDCAAVGYQWIDRIRINGRRSNFSAIDAEPWAEVQGASFDEDECEDVSEQLEESKEQNDRQRNEEPVSVSDTEDCTDYQIDETGTLEKCKPKRKDIILPDTVRKIGNFAFSDCDELESVVIQNGVTEIGDYAFSECSNLVSIEIPESVTEIGDFAFSDCSSLVSIEIPESVTEIGEWAFSDCDKLESVVMKSGVTEIGDYAFSGCSSLVSIEIPEGVIKIGEWAFSGCDNLVSIEIPKSVTKIGRAAFPIENDLIVYTSKGSYAEQYFKENHSYIEVRTVFEPEVQPMGAAIKDHIEGAEDYQQSVHQTGANTKRTIMSENEETVSVSDTADCTDYQIDETGTLEECTSKEKDIILPDTVRKIGGYAFSDCDELESVVMQNGVTEIGNGAFSGCSNLVSIEIPEGVTEIGNYAFDECKELTSVTIPKSVETIGESAFKGCSSLVSIEIPEGVTEIVEWTFSGCDELESVVMQNGVTKIGKYAFSDCTSLVSIEIPESVTEIGDYAFLDCDELESVVMQNGVTEIGKNAFSGCSSLVSIEISESVTEIGENAFSGCRNLVSIEIPESVTEIGEWAFWGCDELESVVIQNGVTKIGKEAFRDCSSLVSIEIPESVTEIGEWAFWGCDELESVVMQNGVTKIEDFAFSSCDNLVSIEVPESVTKIGRAAFPIENDFIVYTSKGSYAEQYFKEEYPFIEVRTAFEPEVQPLGAAIKEHIEGAEHCTDYQIDETGTLQKCKLEKKDIILPDTVRKIGNRAFSGCDEIESVVMQNGVTEIGDYAFSDCSSLVSVEIPESVRKIGEFAFSSCDSLVYIEIPESVMKIGSGAFPIENDLIVCTSKGSYAEQHFKERYPFIEVRTE